MDEFTKIDIDIEVHKAIEAQRATFGQLPNDILREVLGLETNGQRTEPSHTGPTRTRRTGVFAFELLGEREEYASLKDAYLGCLRKLADLDSEFLDGLGGETTPARRIVARKKKDLYMRSPGLAGDFAERLCSGWWVDTNLSRQQCEKRLEVACDVAGIKLGTDLILDFA